MSVGTDFGPDGVDPVTFQIIKHRLARVTDEAVTALKRVSGSPTTNEGHDLMVALYTREGKLLTGGVGFLHHYVGASEATKAIIDQFEGDLRDGDVFVLNDPYTAALHSPDVYVITPIFAAGELRAFAANFVHVSDIGAIDPGGFSPNSRSIHHEGFRTPGIKLIDAGEMREDVLRTILNMTREPDRVELDFRSQIAANNVARDRMRELIETYGAATVERVQHELIALSREQFTDRLDSLPNGEFQERGYLESAPEERIFTIDLTLTKKGTDLTFDFSGTDEQSEVGLNCTEIGTRGGVIAPLFPLLCQDMTWNDGIIEHVNVEAPVGTLVNARSPAPVSIATVATLQICNSLGTLAISKLQGSSDEFIDRATAVWHGSHAGVGLTMTRGEETHVDMITDTFAGAGGARHRGDGIDLGGEVTNVVTRWANVERHESTQPLLFLARRFVPDSGGPGMHRGGRCHEYAVTPVPGTDFDEIIARITGRGTEIPQSTGLFGGGPGCTIEFSIFRGSNPDDELTFPNPIDPEVETDEVTWGNHELGFDDALYVRAPGSGGYGDPLARDPDAVIRDVETGAITSGTARRVYGVPITDEGEHPSSEEIEASRAERRNERRSTVSDFTPPVESAVVDETDRRMGPHVRIVTDGTHEYLRCEDCKTPITRMDPLWKDEVAQVTRPVSHAGIHRVTPEAVVLREYCCPSCGCRLDAEVAFADHPPLRTMVHPD